MTDLARYVWHPQLHRELGERLYFVRLSFEPVYPELEQLLADRLERHGVGSYHAYELIGAFDVMLRIWHSGDIRELIKDLELPELRRADFMEVSSIHEHWALAEAEVDEEPRVEEVSPALAEELNVEINRSEGRDLSRYVAEGYIAPIPTRGGVKFFVSVTASTGTSAGIQFDEVLFSHVNQRLDSAGTLTDGRSVYAGHGFARLLLMGRFDPKDYFEFIEQVVLALNDDYLRGIFSARTSTAFGAQPMPFLGSDVLDPQRLRSVVREGATPSDDEPLVDLGELLEQGENERVEVKASAFLAFDRLVHQGESDWEHLRPEFIKAVCGLLNRTDRRKGTLIVGAVETERYRDWLREYPEDLPEIGTFTLIGLELDNPSGDPDLYYRRLTDALDSAIHPAPTPYMSFAIEKQVSGGHGKELLRIELRPNGKPFYADRCFWVRQGAQVKELVDRDRDEYVEQMKQSVTGT